MKIQMSFKLKDQFWNTLYLTEGKSRAWIDAAELTCRAWLNPPHHFAVDFTQDISEQILLFESFSHLTLKIYAIK